jgi:hypothetical protein
MEAWQHWSRALLAAMGVTEDRLRGNAGWN